MTTTDSVEKRVDDNEVIARAQRAMNRASAKALADYKRFGIKPVVGSSFDEEKLKRFKQR